MSRIQQILSRAERDGTTAGLTWAEPDPPPRRTPESAGSPRTDGAAGVADASPVVNRFFAPSVDDAPLPGRPAFGVKLHKQLVAAVASSSAAAEPYRSLRTRIVQMEGTAPRHILALTSPSRGDGKTLTALNLALSMAQEFDRRTLLIDADLRHARVHTLLGVSREPGLVDVLGGVTSIEQALVTLPGQRLQVLPAGSAHAQAPELLGSASMRRLIEGLRRHFDRIVIDTASAQSADTGALEPCLDGVIVVVRAGHTARPAIERALAAIPPAKLMGMVLNDSRASDGLSGA